MNTYYLVFNFKNKYEYVEVTANQMANQLLPSNDEFTNFELDNKGQYFEYRFSRYIDKEYKHYIATFSLTDPHKISIYDDDLEMDALVESVPWVCYRIDDEYDVKLNITNNNE